MDEDALRPLRLDTLDDRLAKALDCEPQPFRRTLNAEELRKLKRICSLAFGEDIDEKVLEKIMNYCLFVERRMKGRAAGNVEDLIIRYLFRYYGSLAAGGRVDGQCHMEIGVLFGATTILTDHALKLSGARASQVVIDLFEGYYGESTDRLSKIPVDEATFYSNLNRFSVSRESVVVYKGSSADEAVIGAAAKYDVVSLIIDGDHSYDGLKSDWHNFSPLVVPGGYVLLDDFNSSQWPGVTEFVKREVFPELRDQWEVALVYGNSLVLRRTSAPAIKDSDETGRLRSELLTMRSELERARNEAASKGREAERLADRVRRLEDIENKVRTLKMTPLFPLGRKFAAYKDLPD